MNSGADKRSILLVDDVELFLELERTFFHREGFDLLMASNPQEIMQLVLERRPDLIFMDIDVSGNRGDDICRWIKQDRELQQIPVVMLVDSGDLEAEALCRHAGCDALIQRPVRRHQLLSVARDFLDLADRQLTRVATRLPIEFAPDDEQFKRDYSVNLSSGGVFVATSTVLPVDTALALRFQFPDSNRRLACRGRVAWLNRPDAGKKPHLPTGMGIQFAALAEEQLDMVRGYLAGSAA